VEQGYANYAGLLRVEANEAASAWIYYWEPERHTFYMLYLYAKNEQGDLAPEQLKILAKLVREEFK
jgi:hypothetical protein